MSTHRVEVLVTFSVDDDSKDRDIQDTVDELSFALAQVNHHIYSTGIAVISVDGVGYAYGGWTDDYDLG